ncbi:MAG: hypothetical protein ABJA62_11140, partial [Luteimonas sp.]
VVVISGVIGYFTFTHGDASVSNLSMSDRITRIEQEQQTQYQALNERIDRLSDLVESGKAGLAENRAVESLADAQNQDSLTPQQGETGERQVTQRLEGQFESQSVNPKWSLESTRAIENALSVESLRDAGALPPDARNIQCRSSMCRIQLDYADSASAGVVGMMINAAIADRMPYAQTLSQPRSDGGVAYVIYAMRDEMGLSIH